MAETARIRRVRIARKIPSEELRMKDLLQSIANKQHEAALLAARISEEEKELFRLMQAGKCNHLEVSEAIAEVVIPEGRSSSYIDPQAFRKSVSSDKDFYYAITVSITKAKEVLPARALATITKTSTGKRGPAKLVIKRR